MNALCPPARLVNWHPLHPQLLQLLSLAQSVILADSRIHSLRALATETINSSAVSVGEIAVNEELIIFVSAPILGPCHSP